MALSFHIVKTLSLTFWLTQKLGRARSFYHTWKRVVGRSYALSPHSEAGYGLPAVLSSCLLSAGNGELLVSCYSTAMAVHGLASCQGKVCSAIPLRSNWGNGICCAMPLCCLPLRTPLVTKQKDLPEVPEKSSKNTVLFWLLMNSGSEF